MNPPARVLISGIAGYLGRSLCRELVHREWCEEICGFDVKRPLDKHPKVTFFQLDITDGPRVARLIAEQAPDAIVHLAFVVDPLHDEDRMHAINVGGTSNLLEAAAAASATQLLVASSGTAYGAWSDNPPLLREDHPLRANPGFSYSADKGEIEARCQRFAHDHPEVALSIIRPCVVYGPGVRNYISRLLVGLPVVIGLAGYDPPLQFVHEDDVARSICAILEQGATGAFNVAPPDSLPMAAVLAAPGKRVLRLPEPLLVTLATQAWRWRIDLLGAPASFLDFLRYPWVLDSSKITRETGLEFRYSTRETLEVMLRAKGVVR